MQQLITLFLMFLSAPVWAAEEGSSDSGFFSRIADAAEAAVKFVKGVFTSITKAVEWLGKLAVAVFDAAWDMLTDAFVWLLESIFKLVASVLDLVSLDGFSELKNTFSQLWDQIPLEVVSVMLAIGVPSALGIVVTGILIRFSLQLIPFVRLGS